MDTVLDERTNAVPAEFVAERFGGVGSVGYLQANFRVVFLRGSTMDVGDV